MSYPFRLASDERRAGLPLVLPVVRYKALGSAAEVVQAMTALSTGDGRYGWVVRQGQLGACPDVALVFSAGLHWAALAKRVNASAASAVILVGDEPRFGLPTVPTSFSRAQLESCLDELDLLGVRPSARRSPEPWRMTYPMNPT